MRLSMESPTKKMVLQMAAAEAMMVRQMASVLMPKAYLRKLGAGESENSGRLSRARARRFWA